MSTLEQLLDWYRMGKIKVELDGGIIKSNSKDVLLPEDPTMVGILNLSDAIYTIELFPRKSFQGSSYFITRQTFIEDKKPWTEKEPLSIPTPKQT